MDGTSPGAGDPEPRGGDFTPKESTLNTALMVSHMVIGSWAIIKNKPRKFPAYQVLCWVFLTAWRRFICARCRYYGQPCAAWYGVLTAYLMPRDESRDLDRRAMTADFSYITLLILYPLPQVLKSFRMSLLYICSVLVGYGNIIYRACGKCENEFCPMKDWNRALKGLKSG